ncbi:MAG TPA: hypothetical protein P5057_04695, partial [Acidobacteriota bacterium]|nr:hypothetical protein [Acidobacteriota bacterium]
MNRKQQVKDRLVSSLDGTRPGPGLQVGCFTQHPLFTVRSDDLFCGESRRIPLEDIGMEGRGLLPARSSMVWRAAEQVASLEVVGGPPWAC